MPGSIPRKIWGCCKELNLNKNTKIWINYLIGATISVFLVWALYEQTKNQLSGLSFNSVFTAAHRGLLYIALFMMPVNVALETYKWKLLASSAQPLSFPTAIKSYLAGLAISIITPNRIGEYPGRILYLKRKNTGRLISVTFLGIFTQFFTLFLFGIAGLIYYNIVFPGYWQKLVLLAAIITAIIVGVIFFRFEYINSWFAKRPWMRRLNVYSQLMKRFTMRDQLIILGLSMLRFSVFTAQYLILLWWMDIQIPAVAGFLMGTLFFWAMAVIPSIALAELGIRGQVSLFLFAAFSSNHLGILSATFILWLINLVIPALAGSLFLIRMRILK